MSSLLDIELSNTLSVLSQTYGLVGVKTSFEDEGATFPTMPVAGARAPVL